MLNSVLVPYLIVPSSVPPLSPLNALLLPYTVRVRPDEVEVFHETVTFRAVPPETVVQMAFPLVAFIWMLSLLPAVFPEYVAPLAPVLLLHLVYVVVPLATPVVARVNVSLVVVVLPVHTSIRYVTAPGTAFQLAVNPWYVTPESASSTGAAGVAIVSLATSLPALHAFSPGAFSHAL